MTQPLTLTRDAPQAAQLLRAAEAARVLGVSETTVWRWIKSGALPHVRLGPYETTVRIPSDALSAYVSEKTTTAGERGLSTAARGDRSDGSNLRP